MDLGRVTRWSITLALVTYAAVEIVQALHTISGILSLGAKGLGAF